MTGCDVICIAPTEWDGAWQRYHEIMRRLAQGGNAVLVIDGLYRLRWPRPAAGQLAATAAKALRLLGRARPALDAAEPGVTLVTLPPVPARGGIGGQLAMAKIRRALARSAARTAASAPAAGARLRILWCSFPSPLIMRLLAEIEPDLVVYDCASDFGADPLLPAAVRVAERELLDRADLVFTDARALFEAKRALHPRCRWIPTGVDHARFAGAVPTRPRRFSPPVIGYVGTLHAWIDGDLAARVAAAHPEWTFVFAGPRRSSADLKALERLPNVRWLGPQPHSTLPELLTEFDVVWIPYRLTEFTRAVFPTKLLEYMAAGKPVVSTDLPEVRAFAPPVHIAGGGDDVAERIAAALAGGFNARGQEMARGFDWPLAMAAIHEALDEALALQVGCAGSEERAGVES
jgi:UDP-galactopyranose mutase